MLRYINRMKRPYINYCVLHLQDERREVYIQRIGI